MTRRLIRRLLPVLLSLSLMISAFALRPNTAFAKSNGNLSATQLARIEIIVDYLLDKDFNSAAICGILANLDYESGFNPEATSGDSIGICQWLGSRKAALIEMFPSSYKTLESQLEYMYYEISKSSYADLMNTLRSVPDTEAGAKTAGAAWCKIFERPAGDPSAARGQYAADIYWPLYGMTTQAPSVNSIGNTASGIKLTWSSITGADGYVISRSTSGSDNFEEYDRTASTSYTDKDVVSGTTYSYTIHAYNADSVSEDSYPPVTWTRLETPVLVSAVNTDSGVKVTWKASAGAASYYIYRKTDSSSWTKMATAASDQLTWTDTKVSGGTKYTYTVRAADPSYTFKNSAGKTVTCLSLYDMTGVSSTYIPMPVPKASNTASGIRISWSACDGAAAYHVFLKKGSSWERLNIVKASTTSWEWTDAVPGETYTFTVRAYASSASSTYYKSGVTRMRLTVPELKKVSNTASGILLTWSSVTGAQKYRVYRKTPEDSTWKELGDTADASCSWLDESAPAGENCTYTVRAVSDSTLSYYDTNGLGLVRLEVPVLTKTSNITSGLSVQWKAVTGAKRYRIYRKAAGESSWTSMASVDSPALSWTDEDAKSGTVYTYTVRALSGSSISTYDSTGISSIRLSTPVLSSASNSDSGITVKWKAVTGTESYCIYRKTSGSSWKKAGETKTGTTYWTDTDVTDGTSYSYTVRSATTATGSVVRSGYDTSGLICYRLSSVKIKSLTTQTGSGKTTLSWQTNSKADGYIIRYSTDKDFKTYSSVRISSNTTSAKTISQLTKGKTYYVAIRAYHTSALTTFYSPWNISSVAIK